MDATLEGRASNRAVLVRRDKAPFLSGCESRPATVVCGRLLNCKPFLSLLCICAPGALEFAGSVLRDSGAAPGVFLLFLLNEGQPSGWPARASRTVGRGSHPQGPERSEGPAKRVDSRW